MLKNKRHKMRNSLLGFVVGDALGVQTDGVNCIARKEEVISLINDFCEEVI